MCEMNCQSKILYVDDDPENLTGFEASFSRVFNIITAIDSQSAYKILKSTDSVAVVLVDYKMPTEDGISFISRIKEEFPGLMFIITSAWADMDVVIKAMNMNCFYGFAQKPWNHNELKIMLQNALEHQKFRCENRTLNERLLQQNKILEESIKKEREANRVKDLFLENISHEIRTPLNSIIGFSNLIAQRIPSDSKLVDYANIVVSSGHNLLKIIHNILECSLIYNNQVDVSCAEVNLSRLVTRVLGDFQNSVKGKKLNVNSFIPNDVIINNDEFKIQKIVEALVDNAIKFTPKGSVTIKLDENSEISDDSILLCVEDTGVGIAPKYFDKIFEPFTQIDEEKNRKYGGNGIGLFLAKSYAEMLGGKIWVESNPIIGSTFNLTIKKMVPPRI